ncbi:MAG: arsenosugar biosynthesis radical SAM protein ArsS [Lewinellaceae bacterium]|nr:arsenosugar biosynthesis radical SAM protein ArsS [Saprospiraceae bacterium]MCB9336703.1 arsenosugar biosynthesis radical SAM protein ArsS [Lewinellaceae bacterium]
MSIHQRSKSLASRGNELANTFFQLEVLNGHEMVESQFQSFEDKVSNLGFQPLRPSGIEIFQINIGKLCNQSCAHCHVDAGPDRKEEQMSRAHLEQCLSIIAATPGIHTVDITGGAPEMNAHFRWFVGEVSQLGKKIIDRCNLTVIVSNKKFHDLPRFFADHRVNVVSSLPYYNKIRTDAQRGQGVFDDSIKALRMLNEVGYGKEGSGLELDLVYNPSGAFLPGGQPTLEKEFKRHLKRNYDIDFNNLFTITNLPISRFLEYLLESGNYEAYMQSLVDAFNPATVQGLMCRNTISVSWDGYLYDCDFNQMLDLKVATAASRHLDDFDLQTLNKRPIVLNQHCYGCTAGAGSSCGGAIAE